MKKVSDYVIKNKILTMILKKYRVFGLEDTAVSILEFENEKKSKNLVGLLLGNPATDELNIINNLSTNNKYTIRGNIINLDDDNFKELDVLIDDNRTLREYINTNEIFQILSIKKVEENPKIKSVSLAMYYNEHSNDRTEINIPIENISFLRVWGISSDIEYLKNGEYADFNSCNDFKIKINKNKMNKNETNILLDNITICSVGLFFDNGEFKFYNMPFCSDDGIYNKFQKIYSNKEEIEIIFDGKYKI